VSRVTWEFNPESLIYFAYRTITFSGEPFHPRGERGLVANPRSPLPWFSRTPESFRRNPRRPIGLPSPLPSLGCPRTLGSSSLRLPGGSLPSSSSSSRALRRHPSVLSPGSPPGKFGPGRLAEPPLQAPCRSVPALQHLRIRRTLLFTSSEASRMCCLTSGKSRPQGLATLSTALSPPNPWKPLSAPNALGLSPSELFSSRVPRKKSPSPLPPSRFPTSPSGLVPAPRRFWLTRKAVPLSPPEV
jgi:hypothetical protein